MSDPFSAMLRFGVLAFVLLLHVAVAGLLVNFPAPQDEAQASAVLRARLIAYEAPPASKPPPEPVEVEKAAAPPEQTQPLVVEKPEAEQTRPVITKPDRPEKKPKPKKKPKPVRKKQPKPKKPPVKPPQPAPVEAVRPQPEPPPAPVERRLDTEPEKMPTTQATDSSVAQTEAAPQTAAKPVTGRVDAHGLRRYLARLMRALARHKRYPAHLKKEKIEGKVTLEFAINTQGVVSTARVLRGSGVPELDQAAMRMLRKASPLPPIPRALRRESLTLSIPVEYSLITEP